VDNVGNLGHDRNDIIPDRTFIFTDSDYEVVCEGTVIAWEFCYMPQNETSVTFYPGIWIDNGAINYTLVQSNNVTFVPSQVGNNTDSCQRVNLSETDQFTAPAGSVVGLYSNMVNPRLWRTDSNRPNITYQYRGNRSNVRIAESNNINYNIAIRVHLGRCTEI